MLLPVRMLIRKRYLLFGLILSAALLNSCSNGKKTATTKPQPATNAVTKNVPTAPTTNVSLIPYLTPEEEAKTFDIRDGYKLELVMGDPLIKEPVAVAFDGDGRMFVAEMRTYMQDIDGHNQLTPKSCVSVHWSSKHNGVYDKHAIFADNLVLPRMVMALGNEGVLINETDTDDIYLYRDTKHDGVADKKELWHRGGGRGGNLEHQASGMVWSLDNWIYTAVNSYRLRVRGNQVVQENIPANGGQWGITQDDYGKTWNCNAGYEVGPEQYVEPIMYGQFHWPGEIPSDQFGEVWPLVNLADYQGGLSRVRPSDKTLNHFTATCGPDIFRGDRLPADLRGDLLFCEPVGRLIRRSKVIDHEAFTELVNAYQSEHSEFIRATDPNFRPVNLATAPDGTLYVVDMYRGIIQESAWVNPGSYLRGIVEKYHFDRNFGRGRIWRLVHKGYTPGPQPHMLDETPAQLVKHLEHPNGWWRDTAQKLLVLKGDKSVVPALLNLTRTHTNNVVRLQALWTLEGLDAIDPPLIREKFKDPDPKVRAAAIRVSESLYKAGDHSLVPDIVALAKDPDPNVVMQVLVSANLYKWPDWDKLITSTYAENHTYGVQKITPVILPHPQAAPGGNPTAPPPPPPLQLTAEEKQLMTHGEEIYKQLCFACHGPDGKGTPLAGAKPGTTMAPPLSGSRTATGSPSAILGVVLKGLSGPVNGVTYDAQMVPMQNGDDDWIASVTTYVRNSFGNRASFITTNDVALVRARLKDHENPWTIEELSASLPRPMMNRAQWKLTASHNPGALPQAVDGNPQTRYDTHATQSPGMWVQIELPEPSEVSGVVLDAGASHTDFPQAYKVELSMDGKDWGQPVAKGNGTCALTEILFPAAPAKFIRITQTGLHATYFWSIHELQVLQPAQAQKIEVAVTKPAPPTEIPSGDPFNADPLKPSSPAAPANNPVQQPTAPPPIPPTIPPASAIPSAPPATQATNPDSIAPIIPPPLRQAPDQNLTGK